MTKWLAIAVSVVSVCAVVAFTIYTYSGNDDAPEAGAGVEKTTPEEPLEEPPAELPAEPPEEPPAEPDAPLGDPGDLDTTFGTDGIVTTAISTGQDMVNTMVVDSKGRIVVAVHHNLGVDDKGAVARYTPDGELDTSFSTNGIALTTYLEGDASGLAVDSKDRIVVAGHGYYDVDDFTVERYSTDGSLDTSFGGGDGIVLTDIAGGNYSGNAVAVDSADRIVVAGYIVNGSAHDFAVARYTPDGVLDSAFGVGGKVTTAIRDAGGDVGRAVVVDSEGRIVVVGGSWNATGSNWDFAVARYTEDGLLDASFGGGDGIVLTDIGTVDALARAVAIDSDGRIIVAGHSYNHSDDDSVVVVVRYTSAGVLDTGFGTRGIVTTPIGLASIYDTAYAVAVDSQGRIVVAGKSDNSIDGHRDFAVVRYTSAGVLDTSFSADGIVMTDIGAGGAKAHAVAIDSQDRIVVAGHGYYSNNGDFAVVRYLGGP
jgi:uncharacterized delta-60 repeat protein